WARSTRLTPCARRAAGRAGREPASARRRFAPSHPARTGQIPYRSIKNNQSGTGSASDSFPAVIAWYGTHGRPGTNGSGSSLRPDGGAKGAHHGGELGQQPADRGGVAAADRDRTQFGRLRQLRQDLGQRFDELG